ncbi:MAG TPA: PEGA domain-containing protein [Polyangia bacterium]|nr:PEGA domain-containing protein [Polyangia bacterium]
MTAALSLSTVSARAAGNDEESLIREGVEYRRKQNDTAALESFRKAYELKHSARAAAQMGLAEVALGRWVEAAGHLEEAMARSGDPWVAKHLTTLNESYARVRQRVGELEILGGPPGATIAVEGVVVGTLPLSKPVRVRSGDCRFIVSAPGHDPVTRTVDVAAGQLTRETVNLTKIVSKQPVADQADHSGGGGGTDNQNSLAATDKDSGSAAPHPADDRQPAAAPGQNPWPTVGIVLASAGVVAVATGVVFSVKTRSASKSASNNATFDPNADSSGHRYQTLQYVGYGVGAALIAAGVTTYVLGRERDTSGSQPQVAFVPSLDGGAMLISGRF